MLYGRFGQGDERKGRSGRDDALVGVVDRLIFLVVLVSVTWRHKNISLISFPRRLQIEVEPSLPFLSAGRHH